MNLTDEEREVLVLARTVKAFETWEEAKGIIHCGYWHAAANRMYCLLLYDYSSIDKEWTLSVNPFGSDSFIRTSFCKCRNNK